MHYPIYCQVWKGSHFSVLLDYLVSSVTTAFLTALVTAVFASVTTLTKKISQSLHALQFDDPSFMCMGLYMEFPSIDNACECLSKCSHVDSQPYPSHNKSSLSPMHFEEPSGPRPC